MSLLGLGLYGSLTRRWDMESRREALVTKASPIGKSTLASCMRKRAASGLEQHHFGQILARSSPLILQVQEEKIYEHESICHRPENSRRRRDEHLGDISVIPHILHNDSPQSSLFYPPQLVLAPDLARQDVSPDLPLPSRAARQSSHQMVQAAKACP